MKKGIIALICMILTLVFIIVALVGPWFSQSSKGESGGIKGESSASAYLTHADTYTKIGDSETTTSTTYDKDMDNKYIFDNTMYITIIALITAIICIIGVLGIAFNFGNPKTMKMIGSIFAVITFILAIVAIFYFMTTFTDKADLKTIDGKDAGFWYGESKNGIDFSHGPGYAWYLMLVGAILALISAIFLFMDKKAAVAAPPPQ